MSPNHNNAFTPTTLSQFNISWKRSSTKYIFFDLIQGGWDLADWLERLTAKAEVAAVLGSLPASSDTMEEKIQKSLC